eukprot:CAMPEP_0184295526 /NCGR_PEP_ID=MMETSP1049-20130417/6365_1 /TAXON_ID=77928 /ORGANISM="Proteomonas sulcata, Strain CCMP704" /LENGTH=121 /DNA_ID=CAMNT_0026604085 /DNA_START=304 /DNA_END=668 /DNA_ORIENTATION=+
MSADVPAASLPSDQEQRKLSEIFYAVSVCPFCQCACECNGSEMHGLTLNMRGVGGKKREKVLLEKHPHPDSDEGKAYARFWSWVTDYTPFENKKQRGRQVIRHRDLNMVLKHPQPLDSLLQ